MNKKTWTALVFFTGLLCCTAEAQQIFGDDLTLDGAGKDPRITFEQRDGDAVEIRSFHHGAGFYFEESEVYPFFVFESAAPSSLYLAATGAHFDTIVRPNQGLVVTGNSTLDGALSVNGIAQFNGTFDADGDTTPTFTGLSPATPPTLNLRSTNSGNYHLLNQFGHFTKSTTGGGYIVYGFNDPQSGQLAVKGNRNGNEPGVGVGTLHPEAELHIYADGAPFETAEFIVENNVSTVAIREMFQLINNGGVRFAMENVDQGTRWDFTNNTIGDFLINLAGTGGAELTLTKGGRFFTGPAGFAAFDARSNGNVWIAGTYNQMSDRTKKENFAEVDPTEVLEKLSKIPVTEWNYKNDDDAVRHFGPMSQDFHAAFELGESDRVIALADMFGVSVTAIQALNKQSKEKDVQIEGLKQKMADQVKQLDVIQARMELLESLFLNSQD